MPTGAKSKMCEPGSLFIYVNGLMGVRWSYWNHIARLPCGKDGETEAQREKKVEQLTVGLPAMVCNDGHGSVHSMHDHDP